MRTCLFDIETTDLAADAGRMVCACILDYDPGGKHTRLRTAEENDRRLITISQLDKGVKAFRSQPWNDRDVVKRTIETLAGFDIWVTYYGAKFDIPFLRARAMGHGIEWPRINPFHIDVWRLARDNLKLVSRRLKRVEEFLHLSEKKTDMTIEERIRAQQGDPEPYKNIIYHCQQDVRCLEQVYRLSRHLCRGIQRIPF